MTFKAASHPELFAESVTPHVRAGRCQAAVAVWELQLKRASTFGELVILPGSELLSFPPPPLPTGLSPPAAAEQLGHTGRAGWGQIAAPAGLRTSRGEGPALPSLPEDSTGHCWRPARSCFPSAQLWLLPESSTSSLQLPSPSAASPVCAEGPGKAPKPKLCVPTPGEKQGEHHRVYLACIS